MSENSGDPTTSSVNNEVGPGLFSFYTSEVAELMSQDEGLLPFSHMMSHLVGNLHDVAREKSSAKNSKSKESNGINGSASLFSNGIGALLSEFKKERLKSLLRQSVFALTKEVDEMIDPVLSVCRIRSCLKCKERLLSSEISACKVDQPQQPHKKLKILPECSVNISPSNTFCGGEIDDDLRFLLENDTTKVEELVKNHSNEFSATLYHMEQKLEELLNISMTSCRPMTLAEKQQLRKYIQKLPPRNLDRVVEIIERSKRSEKDSCDEMRVDLDEMVGTHRLVCFFMKNQILGKILVLSLPYFKLPSATP
ncbi:hypothetical protein DH2020_006528 [Rehmannia glutinosa]|uniref:NET domain-containing protein n=1 Tax=Rehmannia glutinosa TaxID=99300 RepID=A0ABR0XJ34_REHGL